MALVRLLAQQAAREAWVQQAHRRAVDNSASDASPDQDDASGS